MPIADASVLICTVGGSPAPVIVSLREHRPRFVLFVCSASSASAVEEQILPALELLPEWTVLVLADEQDLLSCVKDIRQGAEEALAAWKMPSQKRILGDFTGGTKVMSAALAMALMEKNVRFTYVGGGERSKNGLGIVQGGEEKIMRMANPWQALAFTHIQELSDAFNAFRFQEAEKLARRIAAHGLHSAFFSSLGSLSHAYALWDGFRYEEAARLFSPSLDLLKQHAPSAMQSFIAKAEINAHALEQLARERKLFMEEASPCPLCLNDLAANALRREREGRCDDAVARLYSLLEKTAKAALMTEYGINTSCIAPEKVPSSFWQEYPPLVSRSGDIQLPLFRSFALLACLGHCLGTRFLQQENTLKNLLQARNFSMLAHGFAPVSVEDCEKLREIVLSFLGIPLRKLTRFPKLNAIQLKFQEGRAMVKRRI